MKRRRASLALVLGLLGLLLAALPALAADDVYSERTMEVSRELRCPICEGQSVADSQSQLALDMRNTIEQQVQAGYTNEEIKDYFVARFGEEVLVEPPKSGINLTLWWIPVVALVLGAVVIVLYLRDNSRRKAPAGIDGAPDPELEELAREALGKPRDGDAETRAV